MRLAILLKLPAICVLLCRPAIGQDGTAATAVPTFHSIGLTVPYRQESNAERSCTVRYHKKGEEPWREGHPLFSDTEGREFRGSLVLLAPGTAYETELSIVGADGRDPAVSRLEAQTWPEDFPIAETVWIEPGVRKKPLVIGRSGSPAGYLLFSARPGREKETVIDVEGEEDNNVAISGDYVIVRGPVLRNARTHAVEIRRGHHIVIERCQIAGWGRPGGNNEGDLDAGVYARQRRDRISQIVVQDNVIGPPRGCANPWKEGHPLGPQAISFVETDGNHVVRYNALVSDDAHRYNDVIGGGWNSGPKGAPHRDSDIYGNLVSHANDDAIEAEGLNINVRIWGNKAENTFVGIALAPTIQGPCYVFRNVITAYEGAAFKLGDGARKGHGALYLYHNAIHSPRPRADAYAGWGGKGLFKHLAARNNIVNVNGYVLCDTRREPTNSFDYDLMNALDPERFIKRGQDRLRLKQAQEQLGFWTHGVTGDPCFADPAKGDFTLRKESPAVDRGLRIPGFNDGFRGSAPDIGPFELGDEPPAYGPRPRSAAARRAAAAH
ncbi:MAG TPA: hypothetical protein VNE39_16555 [Planctomycetota bacterium]|nr:hypothetical protein [Planctomycetota bacterium]